MSKELQTRPSTQSSEEQLPHPSSGPASNAGLGPTLNPSSNPGLGSTLNPSSNPGLGPTLNPPSNPGLEPTVNPPSNPGLEPVSNPPLNPELKGTRIPNPPSRSVPRRPSVQAPPSSLEPASRPPSRPALEPLNEELRSYSDRTISSSSAQYDDPESVSSTARPPAQANFPSLDIPPYPPVPAASRSVEEADQWAEQPTISTASPANDAIDAMPTQMLSQGQAPSYTQVPPPTQASQGQAPSYIQAQGQPAQAPQGQAYRQEQPQPPSYMPTSIQSEPPRSSPAPKRRMRVRRVAILLVLLIVLLGVATFGIVVLLQKTSVPSQPTITTNALGTIVNYAGVDITLVNAKKSQSFLDDPNSTSDGMLRVQLRAQNKTSLAINLPYETIAHVTLPGGKTVDALYVKSNEHLTPNATQTGFVDFAVPDSVRVNQVVFQLGSVDEAQLDIPLTGHANVDQYAPKIVHPNQQISYYNLNWTLTDASSQFSIDGQQASKSMQYLVLTLKVDNPLLETAIPGSPFNYVQLQADKATINLVDTTLPVSFDAGETGKTGTLTFLVPQDATSFTLTLTNPSDGFDGSNTNATATFHL
jgi:hypothetical protein